MRALLPLIIAGAVSAVGAETISDSDRAYLVSHLAMTRDFVRDTTRDLTTKQWLYKSDERRWSIAQCIDHLARTEAYVLALVRDRMLRSDAPLAGAFPSTARGRPSVTEIPRRMSSVDDGIILRWMTDRTTALATPLEERQPIEEVAPRASFNDPRTALDEFLKARAATIEYAQTTNDDLRGHFTLSPMAGFPDAKYTDAYQWLLRMSAHTERHLMQVQEVRRTRTYPDARK
jgi:hypothetical protein